MRTKETWLTARRLQAHGAMIAACLWLIYAWNLVSPGLHDRAGNLKGTDFLHLYTLGSLAIEQRGSELYDVNAQAALVARRVPQATGIRYLPLYPPQVSLFFAPLAHLSYGRALALWWCFSALVYGICCYAIRRTCPRLQNYGGTVFLLAAGYPAFFHLIAWGQTSALALACFTPAFLCLRARRNFMAGVFLGSLIFKPQLGLTAAVVFLSIGAWKIVLGGMLSSFGQLAIGTLYYGMKPFIQWISTLTHLGRVLPLLEPKPYQTYCLRTFWSMLIPLNGLALILYGATAIAVLGATIAIWKRSSGGALNLAYSALLLATVLVAPHLTVYDLLILAPAILLMADWAIDHADSSGLLPALLYGVYALPLTGPITRWTHVQLSVIAMAALVFAIWRIENKGTATQVASDQAKIASTA